MNVSAQGELRIAIVGLGYVGVTAAACLASQGHVVVGVDVNEDKVDTIARGESPITEPQVGELVAAAVAEGRLWADTTLPSLHDMDIVIVCVGTPSAVDGSHNMSYVAESSRQIARALASSPDSTLTVAYRSTFKPGTMDNLVAPLFRDVLGADWADRVELVYNPEFLRESTAVHDYFHPPKIVLGTQDAVPSERMARLHHGIDAPVFEVALREAEITKFIDNSWHATKVAFANEVGRVCAAYGVDAAVAHDIFKSDTKLNLSAYYTRPGGAFGGSCLPKDVRAFQYIAAAAGVSVEVLDSLIDSNESHKEFQLGRVLAVAEKDTRILVAGLAFKAGTDDMRESPNVDLVADLLRLGHDVRVHDPAIDTSALIGQNLGHVLSVIPSLRELLISADEIRPADFDLLVANNASAEGLLDLGLPLVDLRKVSPTA